MSEKPMKQGSFTSAQVVTIVLMSFVIFGILGGGVAYLYFSPNPVEKESTTLPAGDENQNVLLAPTLIQSTPSSIPTYAYMPTITPFPTGTAFVVNTLVFPTSAPQQSQSGYSSSSPSSSGSSSGSSLCAADLDYAAAMHAYNLDMIDYVHSPMIEYYQYLIDVSVSSRDALGLVQAQRGLDNEKSQINSEKSSENQRYNAEKASIKARCN